MRLIPIVPFSLFSYVAGAARVPLARFVWTTAVGYIPITAVFVYLGSKLEELSPTDPLLWAGAAVLIALLIVTRRLSRTARQAHREPAEAEPAPSRTPLPSPPRSRRGRDSISCVWPAGPPRRPPARRAA